MKIFLVNPPCLNERVTDDDALAVPMGLYYIGACLLENGFDVSLINLADKNPPRDFLLERFRAEKPSLIGFSVLNASRHAAMEAAGAIKNIDPHVKIVFGGPCPTFLASHLFSACPDLDYIVKGEGELTFLELVRHVQAEEDEKDMMPDHIKGLLFQKNGILSDTGDQDQIKDIDTLPHPARYFGFQHVSLSRGCPGRCTFCGSPAFWGAGKVRFHSPRWFVDEISLLVKQGINHFFVSDDTFTMDKKRVMEVCRIIIERGLNITWAAISRVDFVDEQVLINMRLAGCTQISFGVESGSEKIRKTLGKPFKTERIIRAFEMTASFGIFPRVYIIYGAPGENQGTIQETIDLINRIRPLGMISYILVLFPGTSLYDDMCRQGRLSDEIWHQKIEDIPWFELDDSLSLSIVKKYGKKLRSHFFNNVHLFASGIELKDDRRLYKSHADFLSKLAMTFSHGDYAANSEVRQADETALSLFERALTYNPDVRAFLGRAMLFQKKRAFQRAAETAGQGLAHFPENRELNICMAVSLMNMGKFERALLFLEKFKDDQDVVPYINACNQRL